MTTAASALRPGTTGIIEEGERIVVSRARACMGTTVSVTLAAGPRDADAATTSVEAALDWLGEVDASLSRFRPESDLARLNRGAGRWFTASPMLFAAVERALQAAQESAGLFDPTLLPQLEALGYDRDFAEIAHRETGSVSDALTSAPPSAPSHGCWEAIILDHRRRRILLPSRVRLDLGGIAKGWAADVALERFCAGYPGALVNVGGDLRVHGGPQPGHGWSIALPDPRGAASASAQPTDEVDAAELERPLATVTLSRGGLATSGAVRRWWLRGGRLAHHLLDPRTGAPVPLWVAGTTERTGTDARRIASVTALAPTAAQAEVATKVALLSGLPTALSPSPFDGITRASASGDLLPQDAIALAIVLGSGELMTSPTLDTYLRTWGSEGASVPYLLRPRVLA